MFRNTMKTFRSAALAALVGASALGIAIPTHADDPDGFGGGGGSEPIGLAAAGPALTASDAAPSDQFGWSVAIGGDTAVAGSWLEDNERGHSAGSVYVYRWNGTQWAQTAKLTAPDGASEDRFGQAVAIHDDLIVVGAYLADVGGFTDAGAAYVFRRNGSEWAFETKLVASDRFRTDHFGRHVALSDAGIAIGAPREERQGGLDQGAVYMFERQSNVWIQKDKLIAEHPGSGDWFGFRLAMDGTTLAVGSQCNDAPHSPADLYDAGSVDIFRLENSQWVHTQLIRAADVATGANFGSSIALSRNLLVIGSERAHVNGIRSGAAYVFVRTANNIWRQNSKLVPSSPAEEDYFGSCVGVSGTTVVVAAEKADLRGVVDSGAVQQFDYSAFAHVWVPGSTFNSGLDQGNELFGSDLAFASGLLMVSAPFVDTGEVVDAGAVFTFSQDDDCNGDGMSDVYQIALGKLADHNTNGIPDVCECLADWDRSGSLSSSDITEFVNDWFIDQAMGTLGADLDGNGVSNSSDLSAFIDAYFAGCA